VNSAIRADVLAAHPFNPDVTMSEDQEWSRRVLEAGLALVYEPAAAVRHSHSYSLRQAFARFRASGASARASYAPTPAGRRALSAAGRQYAREELHWLWTTSQRRWIPYAIVYELSKYAGLQVGLRGRGRPAPGDG
jgi:rhamnosyltransferase